MRFEDWKGSKVTQMRDLIYAKPDDFFVFTRFAERFPFELSGEELLYAESIQEIAGYIRYVFLYDILNEATDDLETDFKEPFDYRQRNTVLLLYFWLKLGKIISGDILDKQLYEFCAEFNFYFNGIKNIEYEIQILNGAEELRMFLINRYSIYECFDIDTLYDICSKEHFSGVRIKNFLNMLFN